MSEAVRATALLERIRLPEVRIPPGDPFEVRRVVGVLSAGAEAMAGTRWRLGADAQAVAERSWRCGPGSTAYQEAVLGHRDRLALAARALALAADAATALAGSLERDQAAARALGAEAEHLVREHDALVDALRRFARDAPRPPVALMVGEVFATARERQAEEDRLARWAERLAVEAQQVRARAEGLTRAAEAAAAHAAVAFDTAASVTTLARRRQAAELNRRQVEQGLVAGEDGSAASRVRGFLAGLGDDVTGPVGAVAGLFGLQGDAVGHWSRLGSGLWAAARSPGDLVDSLLDGTDLRQGDWGHWVGTVAPSALATVGSFGGYGVLRGIRTVEVYDLTRRVREAVRVSAEYQDWSEWAHMVLANGGRSWSDLVPGGGLAAHEGIEMPWPDWLPEHEGGHTLSRHVGLDVAALQCRMVQYRVPFASSFVDRATAERLLSQVLDRNAAYIAQWLASTTETLPFVTGMGQPVGITLVPASGLSSRTIPYLVESTRIKMVLVRDPGRPLGFYVLTAFPTP
ncbi:MAG: RNase A-like domain-containing protein [Candidatus Limnocylindrales bacterium]